MVGGSALDFEIPKMISEALIDYSIVTGRANVRGVEGPRNAVATGLVLVYAELNAPATLRGTVCCRLARPTDPSRCGSSDLIRFPTVSSSPSCGDWRRRGSPPRPSRRPQGTVAEMAKLAADGSPLNVGIAVSGAERAVALHHRDLAASEPLFVLRPSELEAARLRRLGANAARLVKGNPLAVDDEALMIAGPAAPTEPAAPAVSDVAFQDLVDEITAMVVARLLSGRDWRPIPRNHGHAP